MNFQPEISKVYFRESYSMNQVERALNRLPYDYQRYTRLGKPKDIPFVLHHVALQKGEPLIVSSGGEQLLGEDRLLEGRYMQKDEEAVTVLSKDDALKRFGTTRCINQYINFFGYEYRVVGVLDEGYTMLSYDALRKGFKQPIYKTYVNLFLENKEESFIKDQLGKFKRDNMAVKNFTVNRWYAEIFMTIAVIVSIISSFYLLYNWLKNICIYIISLMQEKSHLGLRFSMLDYLKEEKKATGVFILQIFGVLILLSIIHSITGYIRIPTMFMPVDLTSIKAWIDVGKVFLARIQFEMIYGIEPLSLIVLMFLAVDIAFLVYILFKGVRKLTVDKWIKKQELEVVNQA